MNEESRLQRFRQIDSLINLHNTQRYFNHTRNSEKTEFSSVYTLTSSGTASSSSNSNSNSNSFLSKSRSYYLRHNQFSDLTNEELSIIFPESTHPFPPSHSVYRHSKHDSENSSEEYNYIYYLSQADSTKNASVVRSSVVTSSSGQTSSGRKLRESGGFEDSLNWATSNNPKNRAITSYVRNQG